MVKEAIRVNKAYQKSVHETSHRCSYRAEKPSFEGQTTWVKCCFTCDPRLRRIGSTVRLQASRLAQIIEETKFSANHGRTYAQDRPSVL